LLLFEALGEGEAPSGTAPSSSGEVGAEVPVEAGSEYGCI
jgi:hypothetical protein